MTILTLEGQFSNQIVWLQIIVDRLHLKVTKEFRCVEYDARSGRPWINITQDNIHIVH